MKYNFVITSGGTSEKIDNVRKITNSSTGKLGFTIASKLVERYDQKIENIYYICSKTSYKPSHKKIKIIEIVDTNDLEIAVRDILQNQRIDYFIHSMAVSDYTVDYVTTAEKLALEIENNQGIDVVDLIQNYKDGINDAKISSYEENLIIKMKRTSKIISIIKDLSPSTCLVGFKLLDSVSEERLLEVAINLKDKNKCDFVVANDLSHIRNGKHEAFIIKKDNSFIKASGKEDITIKLLKEMFINA